jgi:lambda family phage minor tail protein L
MSITSDIQRLEPGALIELFELDASALGGGHTYFHAGTNASRAPIVWQGLTYQALPIEARGFEFSGKGQLPRPTIKVANIGGSLGALAAAYSDLLGARLIRRRTLGRYLDAVNFTGGNASADPTAAFPDDVYIVDRKAAENTIYIEWELAASFDVAGVALPRRPLTQNICTWDYRVNDGVSACSYTGTLYFDATDTAVGTASADVCGKRLSSCRARHGNGSLPFGGFPGIGITR